MKTYHNSPLLYEEGFSIIINEVATINAATQSTWIFLIFTASMS